MRLHIPTHSNGATPRPRHGRLAGALLLAALAALLLLAPVASATLYQHPFEETFGSAQQPAFNSPGAIAVNHKTGDVLVYDRGGNAQQDISFTGFAEGDQFTLANLPGACSGSETEPIEYTTSPVSTLEADTKAKLEAKCGANFGVQGFNEAGVFAGLRVYFNNAFAEAPQPLLACATVSGHGSGSCTVQDYRAGNAEGIYRYHADGTPASFADLGTDAIDGKGSGGGPGSGGTCTPVSPECDETPQNGLVEPGQIAFDESGGPTDGDIYVTQEIPYGSLKFRAVYIFSPAGRYLGQLKSGTAGTLSSVSGVAIDPSGAVYVAGVWETSPESKVQGIGKYVPEANPPVDADSVATLELREGIGLGEGEVYQGLGSIALGAGPSAGRLFVFSSAYHLSGYSSPIVAVMNVETGEYHSFTGEGYVSIAVDPASGNVLTVQPGDLKTGAEASLVEFDGSAETAGEPLSRLLPPEIFSGFAYSSSGDVYLGAGYGLREPGETGSVLTYGPPAIVPTPSAEEPAEVTGIEATLNGTVEPEGIAVEECFFEYGRLNKYGKAIEWEEHPAPCESLPPTNSEADPVSARIAGLAPGGATYYLRLAAKNENGTERSSVISFETAHYAKTEAATVTGTETATLNGTVRDEGSAVEECFFQYGLASHPGYEASVPCEPEAGEIPVDENAHPVSHQLSGLQEQTPYRFRLVIEFSGETHEGAEATFETFGRPQISEVRARDATQGEAKIEAKVDPSGYGTSYRFEWGPTSSYGNSVPASPESIGTEAKTLSATLTGLTAGTAYHYRVVATNSAGTTETADQTLETLNSCGLFEARCFEMVSPRDPFPASQPGSAIANAEVNFQAADQPGSLAYEVEVGEEGATRGAEILYQGTRSESGWSSSQLSPPIIVPDRQAGEFSNPSAYLGLSADLRCGVAVATQPLTEDPVAELIREAGGANLYRRNPDGTYTLITDRPPEALESKGSSNLQFELIGMSSDCSKVVFSSRHHYAGVPGAGKEPLYEWSEATGLRNAGLAPDGEGGEAAVAATGGSAVTGEANRFNAVSRDGNRVFFSAKRLTGAVAGEAGKTGVFARIDGTHTVDVSASETTTPDEGAEYQGATPDGRYAYFTANAGIAENGASPEGTDLYRYDFGAPEGHRLTDLSVAEAGPAEAEVNHGSLAAVAEDGSHAYFIARAQLVPGKGRSFAQNEAANTLSLYDYDAAAEALRFVGAVSGKEDLRHVTLAKQKVTTSRTSPDGRYLLFESRTNVTGYESGGVAEAYLYDAAAKPGEEATRCLSCRLDEEPLVPSSGSLLAFGNANNPRYQPQSLIVREGRPLAFFTSLDPLAPGAVEGIWNLYEWSHGQVFLLSSEVAAMASPATAIHVAFAGASQGGTDLYLFANSPLNWENPESRPQAWDARVGGGFPEPASPPEPCDPASEGACQGPGSSSPSSPAAASRDFSGPGNVKPKGAGKGASRCTAAARQAKRLSARAKKLRRSVRRLNRGGHHARARKLARKARRYANSAKARSKGARRCRARIRKSRRAGK